MSASVQDSNVFNSEMYNCSVSVSCSSIQLGMKKKVGVIAFSRQSYPQFLLPLVVATQIVEVPWLSSRAKFEPFLGSDFLVPFVLVFVAQEIASFRSLHQ